jgi:glucokinase
VRPAIGVDIGGSGLKVGVVDLATPKVLCFETLRGHATEDPDRVFDRIAAASQSLIERSRLFSGLPSPPMGIGCAGLIDRENGMLATSPNLPGWRDVSIREGMQTRWKGHVAVMNDADAFLLAEWRLGSGKGARNAVFVALGTGVGGGLVLDGKPFRGNSGMAGEIGHMSIQADGPLCACGNRGCLELFVGRKGLMKLALESGFPAHEARSPALMSERALKGDSRAIEVYAELGRRLGGALAGLVNLLEPEVIVVGGGTAAVGGPLLLPAGRETMKRSMVARQREVRVLEARFGPRAGIVGAALQAADESDSIPVP